MVKHMSKPSQGKEGQRIKADWEVRERRFEKAMAKRRANLAKLAAKTAAAKTE